MKWGVRHLFLCLQVFPAYSYIYNAVVMRKWYADLNRYHYFIGLGDFHHKQHPANKEHMLALRELFAHTRKDGLRVLTEDLSVANDLGRRGAQGFTINSRGGLLGGLTDICRESGIYTDNVEYRYARVCALGPVLNNAKEHPGAFESTRKLTVGDLVDEMYTEIDRIDGYQDDPQLQAWYRQCADDAKKGMKGFHWPSVQDKSVAEYLSCARKPTWPFIQQLLTFDAGLLDVKLVHAIVQPADFERTCAIAGGSHIERVCKALQKIGYTPVWQAQSEGIGSAAIDAGPLLHKPEHKGMRPAPISLGELKKFF